MRMYAAAALGLGLLIGAAPAMAQNLNDIGRQLQNQLLPQSNGGDRDRAAYEQGRRDQDEQARRERDARGGYENDRRRAEEDRRRVDDRRQRADDRDQRDRYDRQRPQSDLDRGRARD